MKYKVGGFAKLRGKTKGFRKLPANSGSFSPTNLITLNQNCLLFLVDFVIRMEPDAEHPEKMVECVMWRAVVGEMTFWVNEEVLREPQRNELPEEAWKACGV